MAEPIRILFVCTANICRSPTAEHLARSHAPEGRFEFASAGLLRVGERCPDKLLTELGRRGVDLGGHASQLVTPELLAWADLVVTMEVAHLREVAVLDRSAFAKTVPFLELDRMLAQRTWRLPELLAALEGRDPAVYLGSDPANDVPDPYRRSARHYRSAVDQITGLAQRLTTRLVPADVEPVARSAADGSDAATPSADRPTAGHTEPDFRSDRSAAAPALAVRGRRRGRPRWSWS